MAPILPGAPCQSRDPSNGTLQGWSNVFEFRIGDAPKPVARRNSIAVSQRFLTGRIHLHAHYVVKAPDGCPTSEPSDPLSSSWDDWTSGFCEDYVLQHATLVVSVYRLRPRRLVYRDDGVGLGKVSQFPSIDGGSWDEYIYPSLFRGGCRRANYSWLVTLIDPYGGRAASDGGRVSVRRR